ncbi:MAG: DUF3795 domain-containing protein [Candidatus Marinimicrobia bacterium]|nr:DUF3795 domain-containing protein [Candidatus Neomarinimicrobiota bacterium]
MMLSHLIAPCGMNCSLCIGHLRQKKTCPGCTIQSEAKPVSCQKCIIANCEQIQKSDLKFCYTCSTYPCTRLKNLDKRYRTKYGMSMLENLDSIKTYGLDVFLETEAHKWACTNCGTGLSVHRENCLNCGAPKVKQ